ncbi:MAG: endonuclease MutS2 [Eubacteriales bacterium]|nr:endonuclease MutS2 [Eubacteriales bacterium]
MDSKSPKDNEINKKALRVLEYHKIIDMLRGEACSGLTRTMIDALRPASDRSRIREELADTAEAVTVILRKGTPPFGNFYDIGGFVHLAAKEGSLTPKQLLEVAYNLTSARKTAAFLSADLPELPRIRGLVSAITVLRELEDEIKRCILSEDEIADSASAELKRIRRAIVRQNEAIRSKIQQIVGSAENRMLLQDALVTMRQGRYVIPVKAEHKNRFPGIVHDQSSSGATLFVEPQTIVIMNNELRELELEEKKEVFRILQELSGQVGARELQIKGNQEILTQLDFMFSKGRLACNMKGSCPDISGEGVLRIRKGRHPLIDKKTVVPVDVSIGETYDTLVITGPNTGGKTVTLKTVGLLCLMAQSGLFVPAGDGTVLPVFENIFADIGDEQSIEQSLSTFSSHMNNIVDIVIGAGENTLVLLDELGAGTDPTEGAALAMAVLDHLYGKGAVTLATTHYTELKKYALATYGVQNASMEFDVETLSPTFRLTIGVPGKSNAFEISGKLGLPDSIIAHAGNLLERGDIQFEDVLSSIEKEKKLAEEEREEAILLKLSLKDQKVRMDRLEERLQAEKDKVLRDAREEAREMLRETRETVDEARKEIDRARISIREGQNPSRDRALEDQKRALREKEKSLREKRSPVVNPAPPDKEEIQIGRRVNVLSVNQKGSVLTLPDDKGNFMVQAGLLKLSVNLSDVTLVQENVTEKERESAKYSRMYHQKAMEIATSVNVVGKNLDEAEMEVDKYLDDAFLAGLGQVSIIHGRGAGILRNGLSSMLKRHRHVDKFRKGTYQEGGEGVTIVTLKK